MVNLLDSHQVAIPLLGDLKKEVTYARVTFPLCGLSDRIGERLLGVGAEFWDQSS